jgi:branched-chain amino acid transport system ATP-binding protein
VSEPKKSDAGLRTEGLTVRYGGLVANSDVSIAVEPGIVVGLIGPNGAGKTTFLDAVTGFTDATGEVWLDGERIDALPAHRRRKAGISRTWQSGELFGNLSAAQNLLVAIRPGGWKTLVRDLFGRRHDADARSAVEAALSAVGLDDVADVPTRDLTLGQQKLVGVARALAGGAQVVLLDEPAAGLDSVESQAFAGRVRAIADAGPGHVLEFGKLIFSGTPAEARTDATVVAAYLGAPIVDAAEATHG